MPHKQIEDSYGVSGESGDGAVAPAGLPPMDDELRWILGRPNFTCAGIAQKLRTAGQEIAYKAEDEQAAVIYWMVNLYLKYGATWRDEGKRVLEGPKPLPLVSLS